MKKIGLTTLIALLSSGLFAQILNESLGTGAGASITSGDYDVMIGDSAGTSLSSGSNNTFVGEQAGFSQTSAADNTFIGQDAGHTNISGTDNVMIGKRAGYDNTTGFWNTAVGDSALTDNGVGYMNTALGHGAGCANEHGDHNTFIGTFAGGDNNRTNNTSNANRNTYLGAGAGFTNREGSDNVAIGAGADFGNTNRSRCVFIGSGGFVSSSFDNSYTMTNANDVIAIGYQVYNNAQYSMGFGSFLDQHGLYSIGMGYNSHTESAGDYSVLIGSLAYLDDGYSVGIGHATSIAGEGSIGLGANTSITSDSSIVIGRGGSISGAYSVGIGSGTSITTDNSIAIGHGSSVSGVNSMAIGYGTNVTAGNEVYIGNNATTTIGGAVNWTATSDGRFKKNIESNVLGMDFIRGLKPVTYNFDLEKLNDFNKANGLPTEHKAGIVYSGFIAQDVLSLAQGLNYDFSGVKVPENPETQLYGLRYAEFVVPLVKATQELDQRVLDLENQVEVQNALILAQQVLIEKYNSALNSNAEEMAKLKGDFIQLEDKVESESTLKASSENR